MKSSVSLIRTMFGLAPLIGLLWVGSGCYGNTEPNKIEEVNHGENKSESKNEVPPGSSKTP